MYKFDNRFLDSVGLTDLPDSQKEAFLQYAQDQLETRIGECMSEGLSEDQLDEFERIVDNDADTIEGLLGTYGDYHMDETYQTLMRNTGAEDDDANLVADFVTAKWLNQNCPNYQEIIRTTLEELQAEIRDQKDAILADA